jgi:hypothetical protein
MKINKFIILLLFFSISSCSYQPIFSKKNNLDLKLQKIEAEGNKNIGRKIIALLNLDEGENIDSSRILKLISEKKIDPAARDKAGAISMYRITITVDLSLMESDKIIRSKFFTSDFSYNVLKNKFDLLQYQKSIEINLIQNIADEILVFLNL